MDAHLLAQLKQLELLLKPSRVSPMMGKHEHRQRGRSLEFAGYREYRPGDDPREIDWKLLARTERHYVKQRDTHSPATALVLLDASASMQVHSERAEMSKLRAAQLLAFGLLFTLQRQGDRFQFQVLDGGNVGRPRSSRRAFFHALQRLENASLQPEEARLPLLQPLAFDHVYLISDLLVPSAEWQPWLEGVRMAGREAVALRVLDPVEVDATGTPEHLLQLEGPRTQRQMQEVDWRLYVENFQRHEREIQAFCRQKQIALRECVTGSNVLLQVRRLLAA